MLEIKSSHSEFIEVMSNTQWDYNCSSNKLVVDISPGHVLYTMQSDINVLKSELAEIKERDAKEKQLIESNPALKDIYNKYRTVLTLVKENNKPVEHNV